jgi:subtilisin family serine protease
MTKLRKIFQLIFIFVVVISFAPYLGVKNYISAEAISHQKENKNQLDNKQKPKYVGGEILVKFKKGIDPKGENFDLPEDNNSKNKGWESIFKGESEKEFNIYKKTVAIGKENEAIDRLSKNPKVIYAERNGIVSLDLQPNDPYYSSSNSWGQNYQDLWGIHKIEPESAWDISTGSKNVVVAVIDTGIDFSHEDLADNIWINQNEIPGNNIDDDNNGYVDDWRGWDFVNSDNNPTDDYGHGTHCAGILGATGNNNLGIAGVNWQLSIMAVKFLNSSGFGTDAGAAQSIIYAADMGAKVLSNSWGGSGPSQVINEAINYAHQENIVIVAAAGNSNLEITNFSPAHHPLVIAVGATDYQDNKASFSNWGNIDVVAPGVDILSLRAQNTNMGNALNSQYTRASGTSMATPYVAGLAALSLAKNPQLTAEQIRQVIRHSADDLGATGWDQYFGFGRINAQKAFTEAKFGQALISSIADYDQLYGEISVYGFATADDFQKYILEVGEGINPTSWTKITESTSPVDNNLLANFNTSLIGDGRISLRLTVYTNSGEIFEDRAMPNVRNVFISSPNDKEIFNKDNIKIDIYGNALTAQFKNYILSWTKGANSNSWNTIIDSATPVDNGLLGSWTTPNDSDFYTFRLAVFNTNNVQTEYQRIIIVDTSVLAGWPKKYGDASTSPVFVDLNNNGEKEIIASWWYYGPYGTKVSRLFIFDAQGNILPGWPQEQPFEIYDSELTFADIDKDGAKEIIAQTNNNIYIYKIDGSLLPGWPKPGAGQIWPANGIPAVGDINNDGSLEIIVYCPGGNSNYPSRIYAYKPNGQILSGFPKILSGWTNLLNEFDSQLSVSLADINKDGFLEILAGDFSGKVYAIDYQGNDLPGWPVTVNQPTDPFYWVRINTPTVADLDKDGIAEIVVTGVDGQKVIVLHPDGSILPNWPQDTQVKIDTPAVLADINGDGKIEIIMTNGSKMVVYNIDGTKYPNWNIVYETFDSTPAVVDLDNNGELEIISSVNDFMNSFLNQRNQEDKVGIYNIYGNILNIYSKPLPSPVYRRSPVVDDINNDGKIEIGLGDVGDGQVYLWRTPANFISEEANTWPKLFKTVENNSFQNYYIPDTTGPIGTIVINNNEKYTQNYEVNLTLTAQDKSLVASMHLSNDGINWSSEENFSSAKQWTLSPGDGEKKVFIQYKDMVGNWSQIYLDSIILDSTPPYGSITINQNASWTQSLDATLDLSANDATTGVAGMRFSCDQSNWTVWEPFSSKKSWTFSGDDGTKYIYVQYKDILGNISELFSDSITVDTTPPTGSIYINNNAASTKTRNVTLNISATDNLSGVELMRIANDAYSLSSSLWEPYISTKQWTLASGKSGYKWVYIQFKDRAGNISGVYSDWIRYLGK